MPGGSSSLKSIPHDAAGAILITGFFPWVGRRFIAFILGVYFAINVIFATAYTLGGPCIGEMTPNSFPEAFSIETLATAGYGHMYPANAYGHIVVTIEIILGMFWVAVITGLIFVRFSRPTTRIFFQQIDLDR